MSSSNGLLISYDRVSPGTCSLLIWLHYRATEL